jgi:hypothetical protein
MEDNSETKKEENGDNKKSKKKKNDEKYHFKPSLVPNLINGMNARIEFKEINFNLEDI